MAPPIAPEVLNSPGQPLDTATRVPMETRFGHDFSQVRIHADSQAAGAARQLGARAFTRHNDIYFGQGHFRPTDGKGLYMLAHELAHVAQQRPHAARGDRPRRDLEDDASRAATAVVQGKPPEIRATHDGSGIHCLGEPEIVPDVTFIAQPLPTDNGFIQSAIDYHRGWGFNPQVVPSMDQVVTRLSAATGHIGRMRLVSHANVDNIFMSLFTGGVRGIAQTELAGFGFSEEAGFAATIQASGSEAFRYIDVTAEALSNLRTTAAAAAPSSSGSSNPPSTPPAPPLLVAVGLGAPNSSPTGDLAQFIRRALEIRLIQLAPFTVTPTTGSPRPSTPAERRQIITAEQTILDAVQNRIVTTTASTTSPITDQNLNDLKAALSAMTLANLSLQSVSSSIAEDTIKDVTAANRAVAGGFRGRLNTVKGRFDSSSGIDVRGCRLGQNPDYMRAVQCYFGRSGNVPEVTAPEWFQSFDSFAYQTFASEAQVDALASAGFPARHLSASDVSDALTLWGGATGAAAQFAFWSQLATTDPVTFVSLSWRSSIPGLQMESEIDNVATAALPDVLRTLQRVFDLPANVLPSAANLATLTHKQPLAATLAASMNSLRVLQGVTAPDPAALQALQQQLSQLQQQISPAAPTSSGASATTPSQGSGSTAPTPPAPTVAQLQTQAQALSQTLTQQLAPVAPFLQALAGQAANANALMRFYLNLGFVLPAQSSTVISDISLLAMDPLRNRAITRWLRRQWQGTVPANAAVLHAPVDINTEITRRYAALSDAHQATQMVFAPTSAYMSHIIRVSGGNFNCTPQGSNAPLVQQQAAPAQSPGGTPGVP